jgi:hypothetical protein
MPGVAQMHLRSVVSHLFDTLSPQDRVATAPENLVYGFVTSGFETAFTKAARRLGVTPLAGRVNGYRNKSCGGPVRSADGAMQWLKVSGVPRRTVNVRREREKSAPDANGIRTPKVLATTEWRSRGIEWYAVITTPVDAPTVRQFVDGGGSLAEDETWLGMLKTTLERLAEIPCTHHYLTEPYVTAAIVARFGDGAPNVAAEWRTAHGDLSWPNLTVADLVLYDWETWGLAPRGYDAAYLMVQSIWDVDLMHRLEREFLDEFSTPSGCVGLLVACAEMLNHIEASHLDPQHARNVEAIARRGLARYDAARYTASAAQGV